MQRLRSPDAGHLSCDSALSSYGLFAPLALWRLFLSLRPLVQDLGSCLAYRAPWSSAMPPSLGRGRVTTTSAILEEKLFEFCINDLVAVYKSYYVVMCFMVSSF